VCLYRLMLEGPPERRIKSWRCSHAAQIALDRSLMA
jgi:hypothetical protein